MKSLIPLFGLLATAAAAPFELVSSRPLTERQTGCPRDLPVGNFEFPHLIVPISKANPDRAYGISYDGIITPGDMASIFQFDIPAYRAGQNCTLEFLFPSQSQLTTSSYTYQGPGTFEFSGYAAGSAATAYTTYNQQPPVGPYPPFPPIHMEPGNAYTIDVGPCVPGVVGGLTGSNDTTLIFFQDYGTCPIGVYVAYSG
jgi:Ubiquitin 3 binding protein But2 C-terminal domain